MSLAFPLTTKDKNPSFTSVHLQKVCAKHVDLEIVAFVMSQGALQLHRLNSHNPQPGVGSTLSDHPPNMQEGPTYVL